MLTALDLIPVITKRPWVNTGMQEQWKEAYPGLTGKLLTNVMELHKP